MANVNDYYNFNDVNDVELKAWNRASVFFNIMADEGVALSKEYMNQFSKDDRAAILAIFGRVKNDGYEFTRKSINRDYQARRNPAEDYRVGC